MISGAPSQDSLLPDNRHAADYQQLRERLIQELNLTPQQLHEGREQPDPGRPGFHKIDEMVTLVS